MVFDVHKLLTDVFAPEPGERVLVMADVPASPRDDTADWRDRRLMADRWRDAFVLLGLPRDDVLLYKATGIHNGELPLCGTQGGREVEIETRLARADIVVALTQYSATAPLSAAAGRLGTLRGASMPGVLRRMEQTALAADYPRLARRADRLAERLTAANGARVRFSTGHEVHFDLRGRVARSDNGRCTRAMAPRIINLPGGEAFIVPNEGADPALPSTTEGYIPVVMHDSLLVLRIRENRVVEVRGDGRGAAEMRSIFEADPARRNVAELGLGCNDKAVVSGHVLEDEKAGLHWAYGRSEHLGGTVGPEAFRAPELVVHQDIVYAEGCPVTVARLALYQECPGRGGGRLSIQGNHEMKGVFGCSERLKRRGVAGL